MPPRRLWQLLIAACLLTGSFTDVWRVAHLLAVRHVACPYDGVLVHEDELPAEVRASLGHSGRETKGVSAGPQHEHGACAGLGVLDRPLAVVAISASATIRARQTALPSLPLIATVVKRSVLSYAPKLPPPA